jgi:hypothetical protein
MTVKQMWYGRSFTIDVAQAVLPDKLIEDYMMWSCDLDDRKGGEKSGNEICDNETTWKILVAAPCTT